MEYYYLNQENKNFFSETKVGNKERGCLNINSELRECVPDITYGYNRPLNERCTMIIGQLNNEPSGTCGSLWNNLTRRKSLVIKDK